MRPVVVILAPTQPVRFDVTGWSIGFAMAFGAFCAPVSVILCLRTLNWI